MAFGGGRQAVFTAVGFEVTAAHVLMQDLDRSIPPAASLVTAMNRARYYDHIVSTSIVFRHCKAVCYADKSLASDQTNLSLAGRTHETSGRNWNDSSVVEVVWLMTVAICRTSRARAR